MKILKSIFTLFTAMALVGGFYSCEETTPDPNPVWDTAVHAYAEATTSKNFSSTNAATPVNFKWRWVSVDGANTVNKAEMYVFFNEPYVDKDKNPKTAEHGGPATAAYPGEKQGGKLWKTISAPAANRVYTDFAITQAEIYNLYKDAKFDYGKGDGSKLVFEQNGRTTAKPFNKGDKFVLRWVLYTADGRKFDSWTIAVCGDFVGANCELAFAVN